VRIIKDFKSFGFGSADYKGVMGVLFGSADSKEVMGFCFAPELRCVWGKRFGEVLPNHDLEIIMHK
jgi:hypothetical protein